MLGPLQAAYGEDPECGFVTRKFDPSDGTNRLFISKEQVRDFTQDYVANAVLDKDKKAAPSCGRPPALKAPAT